VHGISEQPPEVFTIWMKSLVLNGSGCTVYDSAGSIVYRVDNYGARRAADVCLMDVSGNVVLQILKKKVTKLINKKASKNVNLTRELWPFIWLLIWPPRARRSSGSGGGGRDTGGPTRSRSGSGRG